MVGVVALVVGVGAGFLFRKTNTAEVRARTSVEAQARRSCWRPSGRPTPTLRKALVEAKEEIGARSAVRPRRTCRPGGRRSSARSGGCAEAEDELRSRRTRSSSTRAAELEERDEKLQMVRAQLEQAAEQHRTQLEKIAGMTTSEARDALIGAGGGRGQALGDGAGPRDRAARPRGGRGARPQDRDDRDPAGRLRADGRVHRLRVRAAERGHEGPDHRPRGPQHPRVRGGDRREPDHRRHARGGGALVLRPGAPRDRPDDPREARRRTGGSTPRGSRRCTSAPSARSRSRSGAPARTPSRRSASPTSTRR